MRASPWVWAGVAAAVLALWGLPRRRGIVLPGEPQEIGPAQLPGPLEQLWTEATMTASDVYDANDARARAANLRAFLDTLAVSEGTFDRDASGGYGVLFGGGTFADFADHPGELGWPGLKLTDAQCAGAGYGPGCVSTAAGRYQIIRPTWRVLKERLGLADFSPASQDAAAIELIRHAGALDDAELGRFDAAVSRVRSIWASLPGAGYGQYENSLTALRDHYVSLGGVLV